MNRFLFPWLGYLPMLDADAGSGGSGDAGQGDSSNSGDAGDGDGTQEQVYRTQAEFDDAFTKRLARERKKLEADIRTQLQAEAEEAAKQAAMSETERLQAERDAADKKASEAAQQSAESIARANKRLVNAAALSKAIEVGIRPDRARAAIAHAKLGEITVDDDGEPDGGTIEAAMKAVLTQFPEWKAEQAASRSGGQFSGGQSSGKIDVSKLSKEEFAALQKRILAGERITI